MLKLDIMSRWTLLGSVQYSTKFCVLIGLLASKNKVSSFKTLSKKLQMVNAISDRMEQKLIIFATIMHQNLKSKLILQIEN